MYIFIYLHICKCIEMKNIFIIFSNVWFLGPIDPPPCKLTLSLSLSLSLYVCIYIYIYIYIQKKKQKAIYLSIYKGLALLVCVLLF